MWYCRFGAVRIEEWVWRSKTSHYLRELPGWLGVSWHGKSRAVQRAICDFGVEEAFGQGALRFKEHYGFELSKSAIRACTLQHAQRTQLRAQAQASESLGELPATGAAEIIAQADGSLICTVAAGLARKGPRPREWKETRVLLGQKVGSTQPVYAVSMGDLQDAGRRWGHCALQAGWSMQSRIHVVGDGAPWIESKSREIFGKQSTFLLDFFHASEYLGAASHVCQPTSPQPWLSKQQDQLKEGCCGAVFDTLLAHCESPDLPDEKAPVRVAHRYLSNRANQLDYPSAIGSKLPIGSGLVESAHRHLLQSRLKKPGATWLPSSADAIAQLRVLRANDQWELIWN